MEEKCWKTKDTIVAKVYSVHASQKRANLNFVIILTWSEKSIVDSLDLRQLENSSGADADTDTDTDTHHVTEK